MSHPLKTRKPASHTDAWAILFMIVVVVGAALFWVSHH